MIALLCTALLIWGAALVSTLLDLRAVAPLSPSPAPPDAPEVAAIVPARNEAHQIAACLQSLLAQEWPRLRVICVEAQPILGSTLHWRIVDAKRGVLEEGHAALSDLAERNPWDCGEV